MRKGTRYQKRTGYDPSVPMVKCAWVEMDTAGYVANQRKEAATARNEMLAKNRAESEKRQAEILARRERLKGQILLGQTQ